MPPKDSKPAQRPQDLPNAGVLWGPRLNSDWDLTFWRKLLETACCFRAHGEMCRTPSCREMICSPHSGGGLSWWVICESKAFFGGVVWCWNRDDWMDLRDLISVLTRQKAIETSGRSLAAGVELLPDFRPAFPIFPRGGSLFGHCAFGQRGHTTASSWDAKDATGKPRCCAVGKPG